MILYSLAEFWHSSYRKSLLVMINTIFSLAVNFFILIFLYIKIHPFSYLTDFGTIPLHYNLYFGIDVYGKWYSVFALPLMGVLVVLINNFIGYLLYNKERLVSQFLIILQLIISLMLLAGAIFIILLNS